MVADAQQCQKKILITVDAYGEFMSANGACVQEIAHAFEQDGFEVHILCPQQGDESLFEEANSIQVHRFRSSFYHRVWHLEKHSPIGWKRKFFRQIRLLMRVRTLFTLPIFPMRNPLLCYRFYKETEKLCHKFSFPLLVSTFSPFESLWAGFHIKRKFDIFHCVYAVDTLTGQTENHILSKKFRDKRGFGWEEKLLAVSDLVLFFKSHEQEFADPKYDRRRNKINFVDVPFLKDRTFTKFSKNEGVRTIVYTGTVYQNQLSLLSSAFDCLSNVPDTSVHFFGPNPTLPQLSFIENKGSVSRETALSAQTSATALMSIGVIDSCFISSKIFEYMSTGKPVIHFYCRDDDPNLPYLKKYPAALLVDSRDAVNENAAMITAFLTNPPATVPFSQLEKLYPENKASHTVRMIRDHFEHQN
jgi:hypothetical protein